MLNFYFLVIFPFLLLAPTPKVQTTSSPFLFDMEALERKEEIRAYLMRQGFKSYYICTPDGYRLSTLFLQRAESTATVIVCAGLCCTKESMATFYALLPHSTNILFFDARGHGQSSGSLLKTGYQYGLHEYKDIVNIIEFVRRKSNLPIIVYGNCAGAYNATRALIHLTEQNKLERYNIKGLIFDSGWGSRLQASRTAIPAKLERLYVSICRCLLGKTLAKKISSSIANIIYSAHRSLCYCFHRLFLSPFLQVNEQQTELYSKINLRPFPILFIHSHDDKWVSIKHSQQLARRAQQAITWWIGERSFHSCHHIFHAHSYKRKLETFLQKVIN